MLYFSLQYFPGQNWKATEINVGGSLYETMHSLTYWNIGNNDLLAFLADPPPHNHYTGLGWIGKVCSNDPSQRHSITEKQIGFAQTVYVSLLLPHKVNL